MSNPILPRGTKGAEERSLVYSGGEGQWADKKKLPNICLIRGTVKGEEEKEKTCVCTFHKAQAFQFQTQLERRKKGLKAGAIKLANQKQNHDDSSYTTRHGCPLASTVES